MTKKPSLGRGLSELLSTLPTSLGTQTKTNTTVSNTPYTLAIDLLTPGKYQPRQDFNPDTLQELAESIRAQGILQPLLVRKQADNRYEIIAGERRWRAAQLAQLQEVPVFIRDISDEAATAMGLIENIQREDLNAIEQAVALKRLGEEFAMTHETIAKAVGKSRSTISNLLRLLQLTPAVKKLLQQGQIEMGHARALLPLPTAEQTQLANAVVTRNLSVRQTEQLARKAATPANKANKPTLDTNITHLERELSDKLGAAVHILHRQGKGKLIIHYADLEALEGVLARIR